MTAQPYNVVAELDAPFDEENIDQLLDPIADHSGAVGRSELGRTEVVFTLPADSVRQANTTALALLDTYPWTLLSMRVLTAADFDRLTDAIELPPLVSVTEAANTLGVSRQGVLNAIKTAKLPATRVGDTWVLRDAAVQAFGRRSA
ncbi:helix-turn-helix domain-containing protein [Rhodococcus qingshengii]|uniref:helix-turn-helix domain-containing protein n=1 Tax=Rhodococcus TaxID=1827 RepID=UPI00136CF451|nr:MULTISPECIES: helix-turn-helix domain-containing protein [Rhodococcus]MBP1054023.1 helix-turn-helix domain-containing protein [Rhodococcus qingshengii]MBP2527569.1 excisionase family DNA binding protein [Rhodococcus sp. PvP104]MDA3637638.1 helix-turn-helix domain-containing protein [Rhodococcus sp. C-2]MYV31702.1 excisionase family DNA-binding protein [Rhodococcus erythropolis]